MTSDCYFIQIRIGQRLKNQIKSLSEEYGYSNADIARVALRLGIQITERLFESQDIMVKEYLRLLKCQSRKRGASARRPECLSKPIISGESETTPA